jgi:hypothetical protein
LAVISLIIGGSARSAGGNCHYKGKVVPNQPFRGSNQKQDSQDRPIAYHASLDGQQRWIGARNRPP